jgi:hypothetical protein
MLYRAHLLRAALIIALWMPPPWLLTEARADENLWGYLYGTDPIIRID